MTKSFTLGCKFLKVLLLIYQDFKPLQLTNCFNIQRSTEFIQRLNFAGMHWITIATIGCIHGSVRFYYSVNKKLTKSLKNTVADLLYSSKKKINVQYVNIQYQLVEDDCGLLY